MFTFSLAFTCTEELILYILQTLSLCRMYKSAVPESIAELNIFLAKFFLSLQ